MRNTRSSLLVAGLAAALLAVGCAGQKEPATKAVADAEAALSSIREDASKYAADELKTADDAIAALKSNLEKGDYKAILAGAPALATQVEGLRKTVADKKAEAEAALEAAKGKWAEASTDLPKMVAAIQSRLDILTKSKKLPKNLDKAAIERTFSPEFRNRLDAWITFQSLSPEIIRKVVDKFVGQLVEQLKQKKVSIELTDEARSWLAEKGYDRLNGARPMARIIQNELKRPLADAILFGELQNGGLVRVKVEGGKLALAIETNK